MIYINIFETYIYIVMTHTGDVGLKIDIIDIRGCHKLDHLFLFYFILPKVFCTPSVKPLGVLRRQIEQILTREQEQTIPKFVFFSFVYLLP